MVAPISSLMNMETALYGGMGPNAMAPSFANGYKGGVDYSNTTGFVNPYGYNNYTYSYPQMMPSQYSAASQFTQPQNVQQVPTASQSSAQATDTNKDLDILVDYFSKNNAVEEGIGGAMFGGLTFAAFENPQTLAHLKNAYVASGKTSKIFKGILDSTPAAKALWQSEPAIMQDAYSQLYRVMRNSESKWGISKWFVKPMEVKDRNYLKRLMTDALKSGDKDKIQLATEQLRAASKNNGRIPQAWDWIKSKFTGKPVTTMTPSQLADEALTSGAAQKAIAQNACGFAKKCINEGKGFFIFDLIFSAGKIWTAFTHKDGGFGKGCAQTGQSLVNAAGSGIGWGVGKVAGAWAGAKLGAKLGSKFSGWGTLIGSVCGFIGGSLGMLGMSKITKAIVGEDVAKTLEAKDKKSTPEGQAELLSLVVQKAQAGEKIPDKVMLAAQNVAGTLC